jgi:predicted dehydrogenase
MCDAVARYGRIWQTGSWQRSQDHFRFACELVRNGRIGTLKTMKAGVPKGYAIRGGDYAGVQPPAPVPEGFDYDMWLGPAPWEPYTPGRCHFNFRWIMDYGEGYISDWGAHYYDVAQWGNGSDLTGPVLIEGRAEFPRNGLYDAPIDHHIEFTYANGAKLVAITSANGADYGVRFEGAEGWIHIESNTVTSEPASIATSIIGPNDIHLYDSRNHHRNFIDCVLSRKVTTAPVEVGHRSASLCHLGTIMAVLGRNLKWDPVAERFPEDEEANRMLARTMRDPWHV